MAEKEKIGDRTELGRTEATWVAKWLEDNGAKVESGWLAVYKMTPFQVAKKYHVTVEEVISAAKGEQR